MVRLSGFFDLLSHMHIVPWVSMPLCPQIGIIRKSAQHPFTSLVFIQHSCPLEHPHCVRRWLNLDEGWIHRVASSDLVGVSVQFSSVAQSCPTLCNPMDCSMPGLLEFTQTHVRWVGDATQPSHPLLSPSPPSLNLSQHQGLFKWVRSSHQVAEYWSFGFNSSPSNEHPGLISFRMGWLYLLAVLGTLKGLLQHHSSKASILWSGSSGD